MFMWSAKPVQLLSPSQSSLARRRETERRKKMEVKKFEQIVFKDDGLKAIQTLIKVSENRYHSWQEKKLEEQVNARKVLHMLEKIELLNFLREVWRAQELSLCVQFVQNWNSETKTTHVSGSSIDASFHNFSNATSRWLLDAGTEADAASAAKMSRSFEKRALSLFSPTPDRVRKGGFRLDDCNQSTLNAVLKLLNMTLWGKASGHNRVCNDLLYLVVQSYEGKTLNWKKLFYDKFVWEMARLKALLEQQDQNLVRIPRIQTVLGPVMCYLYSHRQRK